MLDHLIALCPQSINKQCFRLTMDVSEVILLKGVIKCKCRVAKFVEVSLRCAGIALYDRLCKSKSKLLMNN